LWSFSPAGLRLEISCESDKKKMNLIFDYDKKIFLTEKLMQRVAAKTRNRVLKKFRGVSRYRFGLAATNRYRY
jgi:hypothetical protein